MAPIPPRRRAEFLLVLFAAGFLVLLTVQIRRGGQSLFGNLALSAFGPLLSTYDAASRLTREGLQAYLWQKNAALDAERLAAENRELKGRLALSRDAEAEVLALRELLKAPKPQGFEIVTGRALTRYGEPFGRYLLVSCGSRYLIPDNTPVMDAAGVVGRVQGSSASQYRVLLVTDPTSSVGVASERTGVRGVAVGRGGNLEVRWISNEADVKAGDVFATSGEDGIFPAGLRVGTVESAENGPDYLKRIVLNPMARLDQLTWVLLVRKTP